MKNKKFIILDDYKNLASNSSLNIIKQLVKNYKNVNLSFMETIINKVKKIACKLFGVKYVGLMPESIYNVYSVAIKSIIYLTIIKPYLSLKMALNISRLSQDELSILINKIKSLKIVNMQLNSSTRSKFAINDIYGIKFKNDIIINTIPFVFDLRKVDYISLKMFLDNVKPEILILNQDFNQNDIDYKKIKIICKLTNTYLIVNASDNIGLLVSKIISNKCNPIKHADIIISETNGHLMGPLGVVILTNNIDIYNKLDIAYDIEKNICSLISKGDSFKSCFSESYVDLQNKIISNTEYLYKFLFVNNIPLICHSSEKSNYILIDMNGCNISAKELSNNLKNVGIFVSIIKNINDKDLIKIDLTNVTVLGINSKGIIDIGILIHDIYISKNFVTQEDVNSTVNSFNFALK